jgi:hypothetical protein
VRKVPGSPASRNRTTGRGLTGVVHAQFKRPQGMGLELKLQRGPWARGEAESWLEGVCGAAEGRVHGGVGALSGGAGRLRCRASVVVVGLGLGLRGAWGCYL